MTHRRLRVLHPLSAWGGAHVQTCINLLKGISACGVDLHLDLPRVRVDMTGVPHAISIPAPLSRFGLPRLEPWAIARAEARFLSSLREGDVAWLWPGVSIDTFRRVAGRGIPIVMEGINTRIASARRILQAAYDAEGEMPHYDNYSDARIAEEEEALSLASHFFSPSPGVDAALEAEDSSFRGRVLRSSYGAWLPEAPGPVGPQPGEPVTVLFMGSVGLRKNAHGLLRAWAMNPPKGARLRFCGAIEPAVQRICAAELALPSVETAGHVRDVAADYRAADVFVMPALEEGDPQVTYEAAGHGLAILASPMGGGRMAERSDAVWPIDPYKASSISAALHRFVADADLRAEYGARARAAAQDFDWMVVGAERARLLRDAFPGL